MFESSRSLFVGAFVLCLMNPGLAFAEKNPPAGSQPTDPQTIIQLYNGTTSFWDQGGSAWWGPGGKFESTGGKGEAYGKGKWYVTNTSKLCQDADYYKAEGNAVKSENFVGCWQFATAPDGVVWEKALFMDGEWYQHRADKQRRGNGNGNAAVFNANGKKLGF